MKVLVVGAGGRTGRAVVAEAVRRGHEVTAFVRRDEGSAVPGVVVRVGSADERSSIDAAVSGQDAVIDTVGGATPYRRTTLETEVVDTLVAAMRRHDVRRLLVTSSVGVGDSSSHTPFAVKVLQLTYLRGARRDKAAMESVVRSSGLDWIIIRPAVLTDQPATGAVRLVAGTDREKARAITRADLASYLVDQLTSDDRLRQAVSLANR